MPITKSAKKSLKVSKTKQSQNTKNKIGLEKAMQSVSKDNISEVISLIDKAAKTHIIHKNKAARLKSTLTKKFGTKEKKKTKTQKEKSTTKIQNSKIKSKKPTK